MFGRKHVNTFVSSHFTTLLMCFVILLVGLFISESSFSQDNFKEETKHFPTDVLSFFNSIYNYNFHDAQKKTNGNYPGSYSIVEKELVKANYFWWLIISGENTSNNHSKCIEYLDKALEKLKRIENEDLKEPEIFSFIYIYAYKARLEIFNHKNLLALKYLYNSMQYIETALKNSNDNDRYKFVSGIYNYFVAYTIEKYPFFYPYFFLFPKGDKKLGLEQLKACSQSKDILVRTESIYFLMKINLEFENDYNSAFKYSMELTDMYHQNLIYNYYKFRTSLELNDTNSTIKYFRKLLDSSYNNDQLTQIQRDHLLQIARLELEKHNINIQE